MFSNEKLRKKFLAKSRRGPIWNIFRGKASTVPTFFYCRFFCINKFYITYFFYRKSCKVWNLPRKKWLLYPTSLRVSGMKSDSVWQSVKQDLMYGSKNFWPKMSCEGSPLSIILKLILSLFFPIVFRSNVFFSAWKIKSTNDLQSNVVGEFLQLWPVSSQNRRWNFRHLHTRISDHKEVSSRTGTPLSQPPNSRIRDHVFETGHRLRSADFKMLAKCQKYDLKVNESIIIHRLGSTLNSQDASVPLDILR